MPRPSKKRHKLPTKSPKSPPPRRPKWLAVSAIVAAVLVAAVAVGSLLSRSWRGGSAVAPQNGAVTPVSDTADFSKYAGSASCKGCHQSEYDRWTTSHHGLAERPVQPALDSPAFTPSKTIPGTQPVDAHMDGTACEIAAADLSGKSNPHAALRVIGVDPLRQFLVDAPGGRLQAMEAAYDPNRNDWFDVFGNEDRQPGEWGHWTGRGMNWNSMCAACHNTRLVKNYVESTDTYQTKMAEMGVGCEACHRPMKSHVTWQQDHGKSAPGSKDPTLSPPSRDQVLDTCGSCHARGGAITGDFTPGQSFFDHYSLTGVDETETFYADGQIHEEDYEYSAFLGSKMHAAGVRCGDCHDMHSGKTLLEGNALCMRCHTGTYPKAPVINPLTHTFHLPTSPGSQCVNCHMPQTKYMQRHARHDHGFTIPDPLLTKQTGIPNACNRCHTDKDADWATASIDKWHGTKMDRPTRHRALTIASARKGDETARPALLALLNDPQQTFYWKSAFVRLLGRWATDPTVQSTLIQQLRADHPMVRESAAMSLGPMVDHEPSVQQAIEPLQTDVSRNVRVAAAQALGAHLDANAPAAREFLACLRLQADQPTGQFQLAVHDNVYGHPDAAIEHIKRALDWDHRSPALRREAAVLYGTLNKPAEALVQIEEACRLEPGNAEYAFLCGLAAVEVGKLPEGMESMQRAVQLDPHLARAWYNLGLLQQKVGRMERAMEAFKMAESADAADAEIPYARAVLLSQMNRRSEARTAAQRALQLAPGYPDATDLLRSLQ